MTSPCIAWIVQNMDKDSQIHGFYLFDDFHGYTSNLNDARLFRYRKDTQTYCRSGLDRLVKVSVTVRIVK